ncbi:6,7-dimethyl-8-ribityllumazine synthase [Afifella sp. IM 167]|uniref:6,7-dimethyl-8-ribityllumazine synthase n=1 Tax=Afifella sp. IM 167 TaxID=2033586 RepID=UPI001CC95141|nr:6,7-dimethyl-8-ribityllumazine synthase [Afifella sp. IM 167]MBZ8132594.1 6,7-dimethyl-8-ribityllumazine synthase [Afifella sp. IM 167]
MSHFLIIEARFYHDLAEELARGATAELDKRGITWDRVAVPGVLEIPGALAMALIATEEGRLHYDGYVLLGCVIRGETGHYDIVAGESARAVMDLVTDQGLALGNGILTVENALQAWARAGVESKNKGADAAAAAAEMAELRGRWGLAGS